MPFGVVSGVGRRMGVLDGGGNRQREVAVLWINVGYHILTNGILCVRGGDAALPKLLWDFLLLLLSVCAKYIRDCLYIVYRRQ